MRKMRWHSAQACGICGGEAEVVLEPSAQRRAAPAGHR